MENGKVGTDVTMDGWIRIYTKSMIWFACGSFWHIILYRNITVVSAAQIIRLIS